MFKIHTKSMTREQVTDAHHSSTLVQVFHNVHISELSSCCVKCSRSFTFGVSDTSMETVQLQRVAPIMTVLMKHAPPHHISQFCAISTETNL